MHSNPAPGWKVASPRCRDHRSTAHRHPDDHTERCGRRALAARATLFVMAADDAGGLGESGPVVRYDVRPSSGTPTLERTIDDPSFFRPLLLRVQPLR